VIISYATLFSYGDTANSRADIRGSSATHGAGALQLIKRGRHCCSIAYVVFRRVRRSWTYKRFL